MPGTDLLGLWELTDGVLTQTALDVCVGMAQLTAIWAFQESVPFGHWSSPPCSKNTCDPDPGPGQSTWGQEGQNECQPP